MADELILRAEPRTVLGKKVKQLRREGLVPGVVYGPVVRETIAVTVNRREFDRFYRDNGHSTVFSLVWEGGRQPVLIREVQSDPVSRNVLHVDFFAPNMRQVLRQFVPLVLHSPNADAEGVLQTVLTEIEVEALPADLPHQLDADISALVAVGDNLHVSDIVLTEGVTIITDSEELVASLVPEAVEEEPEEVEAAEGEEGAEAPEGEGDAEAAGGDAAGGDDSDNE